MNNGFFKFTLYLSKGRCAYFEIPLPISKEEYIKIKQQVDLMCDLGLLNHESLREEKKKAIKKQRRELKDE